MDIGIIGLGKMGLNIGKNLLEHHHSVIGYDTDDAQITKLVNEGGSGASSSHELCKKMEGRRIIWMMLPAGEVIDQTLAEIIPHLSPDDIIIDGGNSFYKDSIRRYNELRNNKIIYLDCGTSGGIEGARHGACLMIGGDKEAFEYCEVIFNDISVRDGYVYTGESGTGHFVKMVHNGIEYGMMQAIAEGFSILEKSPYHFELDEIARTWNHGSVIRGWLMELTQKALSKDPVLLDTSGQIGSSGEGKWASETAMELGVPVPVITLSLLTRYASKHEDSFSNKIVAALRQEFGGHDQKIK